MNNDLAEGIDFYYDESGLTVFKQKYHLERGYCCGNDCRHCPYDFENVTDEKKRIQLILNENKRATGQ